MVAMSMLQTVHRLAPCPRHPCDVHLRLCPSPATRRRFLSTPCSSPPRLPHRSDRHPWPPLAFCRRVVVAAASPPNGAAAACPQAVSIYLCAQARPHALRWLRLVPHLCRHLHHRRRGVPRRGCVQSAPSVMYGMRKMQEHVNDTTATTIGPRDVVVSHPTKTSSMVNSVWCKIDWIEDAANMFEEMLTHGAFDSIALPSEVSWTTFILACVNSGDIAAARRLFDVMPERTATA